MLLSSSGGCSVGPITGASIIGLPSPIISRNCLGERVSVSPCGTRKLHK